ncbi:ribosome-associated translation inhibitor RaiA [Legionella sp. W05-934-2]|uniref:ribosome hibernation-promoting factor, HPF/YfiA family n=1 Tax=Legionella sp. W05-934-2 TaxID=1198649 RepID=UPI0034627088
MQINMTGHRMELTPALKQFTQEKFDKLEKHFDKITSINIVFDVEKVRQIAEATILVTQGELHARSETDDMYASVDDLVNKLDRQLLKHKEKLREKR